jgi:hypothetical protein
MSKIILGGALAIAFTLSVQAQGLTAENKDPLAHAMRATPLQAISMSRRSGEVSDGALYLRKHGSRFEAAIRLIEAEAAKPEWGWDEGCGQNCDASVD